MNRREFSRFVGSVVIGTSLAGCIGGLSSEDNADSPPSTAASSPLSDSTNDIEDRVRFTNLEWGSHCVPTPCMWSIQAVIENLSGESFVVGVVLMIQTDEGPKEYTETVKIEAWGETEITIRTDIPDTELQPDDYELVPVKVEQSVTPTPVPNPENYARIVEDLFVPDSIMPKITGVIENISDLRLSRVRVQGTFFVGDQAAEASNVVERDLQPGERRSFSIRYFRGNEANLVDGHEVEVIEVYL